MNLNVSIIIPSLNAPTIDAAIQSIHTQITSLCIVEIIVVGLDNSNLISYHPTVKFISTQKPVSAAVARNIGIKHAQSDWIIFIDADCVAEPRWLENLMNKSDTYQIIGGSVDIESKNYWTFADNLAMFHSFLPNKPTRLCTALPTLNLAIYKEVITSIGLMDEKFVLARGEDFDWTLRMHKAGYKLLFEPNAIVLHQPSRSSLSSLLKHSWKSGFSMSIVRQRYSDYYSGVSLLRYPIVLQSLAPIISFILSIRICLTSGTLIASIKVWPAVLLAKLAWCLGAAFQAKIAKQ